MIQMENELFAEFELAEIERAHEIAEELSQNTDESTARYGRLLAMLIRDQSRTKIVHEKEKMKMLLKLGAEVNVKDRDGATPLHLATSNAKCPVSTIEMLVKAGAEIDAVDARGMTPLLHAARMGHKDAVKYLLAHKASVTHCDLEEKNALHWCCEKGHGSIVPLLVKAGADVNRGLKITKASSEIYLTPLMHAVMRGSVGLVDMLLKNGVDTELTTTDGDTALHLAVKNYFSADPLVKLLLEAKANPDAANEEGATPLMLCRQPKSMEQFINKGANVDAIDKNGRTALIRFFSEYRHDAHLQVAILINVKANLDIQDNEGKTALMYAVRSDAEHKSVRLLVDHGANIDLLDNNGQSATAHASPDNFMFLINAGAKPNPFEMVKWGGLENAIQVDNLPLATLLLERSAKMKLKLEHFIRFKKTFEKLARANSDLLRSAVICTDPEAQEQFDALLIKFARKSDVAEDGDLPAILKKGAWPLKIPPRIPIILPAKRINEIENSINYYEGTIHWPDELRESVLRSFNRYSADKNQKSYESDKFVQNKYFAGLLLKKGDISFSALFKNWTAESDEAFIEFWNKNGSAIFAKVKFESRWSMNSQVFLYLLARFDIAVLRGVLDAGKKTTDLAEALRFVDSPGCASIMSRAMVSGSITPIARQWALRFPESCTKGLIVAAVSKAGKDRTCAEASLRFLAANGHKQVVERVAAQHGDDVVQSIVETLAQDHRMDFMPTKAPIMPKFWSADVYPPPRLKSNNKELPDYSIAALSNMMSLSNAEQRISALDDVIEACDPKSLASFAWGAFEEWAAKGQKDSEWIFDSLAYLGDDTCARKLTPYIRNWPRENGIARARKGLEILAAIGTDVALSQIQAISQKNKYQVVLESAQEMMKRIAVARDLTPQQLEDRLVPDFGLSEKGDIKLDFGSRCFMGSVDALLKPVIKDANGTVLKALPAAGKDDDKALAKESTAIWSDLCNELKPVAKLQLERLELAMVNSRRWSGSDFKALFVASPLLQNLVKGLVWGVFSSKTKLSTSFMVTAENAFVDAQGSPVKVADGSSIGIVHPLLMDEPSLAAWQKLFTKNKQVQPFPQLVRKTYRAADDTEKNRFGLDGATVASKALKGLLGLGWSTSVGDAGWIHSFEKSFSSGYASLGTDPGVHISDYEMHSKEQKLDVSIPDTLNPMEFSELIRELMSLKK